MGVQSKQIFEFDSYELDKTFADFDNFVLIKIKSIPPESPVSYTHLTLPTTSRV